MPTITKQTTNSRKKTTVEGVIGRIKPVELGDGGISLLAYGKSGTGKTTLACTFPKPLLILGTEDGTRSVHNVKGVDFVRFNDPAELDELTPYAGENYKTVVLDTATGAADLCFKEVLGLSEMPVQKAWGMATRQQYGTINAQVKERMRRLLDLRLTTPINVVILAQERVFGGGDDEGSGAIDEDLIQPNVGPALSPGVATWLTPACDYVVHLFLRQRSKSVKQTINGKEITVRQKDKGADYCCRTGPHATFSTKFRVPKGTSLPEYIVDADYGKIVALIGG